MRDSSSRGEKLKDSETVLHDPAQLIQCFACRCQLQNVIQGAGIFVALFTAIIALATADRKRNQVNIKVETSIDQSITYHEDEMTEDCQDLYKVLPRTSHHVNFKMTNLSGFTLKDSTLVFRIPYEKQPPRKRDDEPMYRLRGFTLSITNAPQMLFAEVMIISIPFLPYWNHEDSMTIWVRMITDEPFMVKLSVNCSNADGKTYPIEIGPRELLRG